MMVVVVNGIGFLPTIQDQILGESQGQGQLKYGPLPSLICFGSWLTSTAL